MPTRAWFIASSWSPPVLLLLGLKPLSTAATAEAVLLAKELDQAELLDHALLLDQAELLDHVEELDGGVQTLLLLHSLLEDGVHSGVELGGGTHSLEDVVGVQT